MKIPVPDTVFYRVGDLQHATLMKKAILISLFSSKFGKIFKNNYFTEHLRVTSSTDPHKSSKNIHKSSGESPETMRKLCFSTKFSHQEIK